MPALTTTSKPKAWVRTACGRSRRSVGRTGASARVEPSRFGGLGGRYHWPAAAVASTTGALALKFVAHHLWDPSKRASDPRHGMPRRRRDLTGGGLQRCGGPRAPKTVKRRLASWSTLHCWKGIEGPFAAPSLRSALRLAVRASPQPRQRKWAVTEAVLDRLIATCAADDLANTQDLAILLLAFASGGAAAATWRGCGSST
jgi:integrase